MLIIWVLVVLVVSLVRDVKVRCPSEDEWWELLTHKWQFSLDIFDAMCKKRGRMVSLASLFDALESLERDGWIESRPEPDTPLEVLIKRGGYRRFQYRRVANGRRRDERESVEARSVVAWESVVT